MPPGALERFLRRSSPADARVLGAAAYGRVGIALVSRFDSGRAHPPVHAPDGVRHPDTPDHERPSMPSRRGSGLFPWSDQMGCAADFELGAVGDEVSGLGYLRLGDPPVFAVEPRSSACSAFSRLNAVAAYAASSSPGKFTIERLSSRSIEISPVSHSLRIAW
jgi:hypothetical protein